MSSLRSKFGAVPQVATFMPYQLHMSRGCQCMQHLTRRLRHILLDKCHFLHCHHSCPADSYALPIHWLSSCNLNFVTTQCIFTWKHHIMLAATGCRICHFSMTQFITTYCMADWEHLRKIFTKLLSKLLFTIRSWPCLMGTPLHPSSAAPHPPAAPISLLHSNPLLAPTFCCTKSPCCTKPSCCTKPLCCPHSLLHQTALLPQFPCCVTPPPLTLLFYPESTPAALRKHHYSLHSDHLLPYCYGDKRAICC